MMTVVIVLVLIGLIAPVALFPVFVPRLLGWEGT